MKTFFVRLTTILTLMNIAACAPQSKTESTVNAKTSQPPAAGFGGSSGAGGFVSENSELLLTRVRLELATEIRRAEPEIFADLPSSIPQARLADIIERVRISPSKTKRREEKDLMFDFGRDDEGPYIEVLQPFFYIYGPLPVKFATENELRNVVRDLKLKMLHEASHLYGLDEAEAEAFGLNLLHSLETNFVSCKASGSDAHDYPGYQKRAGSAGPGKDLRLLWLINRTSGLGLFTAEADSDTSRWDEAIQKMATTREPQIDWSSNSHDNPLGASVQPWTIQSFNEKVLKLQRKTEGLPYSFYSFESEDKLQLSFLETNRIEAALRYVGRKQVPAGQSESEPSSQVMKGDLKLICKQYYIPIKL